MHKLIRYALTPITLGLLAGFVIVLASPELRYSLGDQVRAFFTRPDQRPQSFTRAVNLAADAVVNISTRLRVDMPRNPLLDDPLFRYFFNSGEVPEQRSMSQALGSGVIVNLEGYILTNHHVIRRADEIIITLRDGRNLRADLVGSDPEADLAVLKIPGSSDLPTVPLGEMANTRVGDIVLAIGNPFNLGQTVTQGIVSATGRRGLGINVYENFIQTDAAINQGNSGGALVNSRGELLGINTAILTQNEQGGSLGIGFAIPADIALSIMGDIIKAGRAIRGWLGVEAGRVDQQLPVDGIYISNVDTNGPAHKAGLQSGDILTHVNDQRVFDLSAGMNLIARIRPNERVKLTVQRRGEALELEAIVGIRPSQVR